MGTTTIDSKGRLSLPRRIREELGLAAGDVVFVQREGDTVRFAKAVNPLQAAVAEGVAEYRAGRKIALGPLAKKHRVRSAQLENAIDDVIDAEEIAKVNTERGKRIPLEEVVKKYRTKR
ncbi:MAG: AbrB/MazE/SpoVT family DNA-binding domain-containing protein [Acidobacteriia bacterium]|nr:AbrB/MazE/SpoVT family DNA-binding domain-containing protein [Terriglobia bacterium]